MYVCLFVREYVSACVCIYYLSVCVSVCLCPSPDFSLSPKPLRSGTKLGWRPQRRPTRSSSAATVDPLIGGALFRRPEANSDRRNLIRAGFDSKLKMTDAPGTVGAPRDPFSIDGETEAHNKAGGL